MGIIMETIDINQKINDLYDFFYNNHENNCYKLLTISNNDINDVDSIKFTYKYRNFSDKIVTDLLNSDLKLIDLNDDLGRYHFKRNSNNSFSTTIIIGTYDKSNKNINDLSRKENIEILVSYLLSNL